MNKLLIVTFLTFITLGQSFLPAQQCIKSFFKSAQSIDVKISNLCFGSNYDADMKTLVDALNKEDVPLFIATVKKIGLAIYTNCPTKEAIALVQIIQAKIADKSLFDNIVKKGTEAIKVAIKEFKAPTHTGESIGTTAGTIVSIFIKQKKFLEYVESNKFRLDLFTIVKGLLKGLGKDETSTKCHDDIVKHKDALIKIIVDLIEAIKSGKDIMKALQEAFFKLMGMMEVIGDCRLMELVNVVMNVITKEGVAHLVERIKAHIPELISIGQNLIQAFVAKDDTAIGMNFGKVIKIVLDFYVN